MRAVSGTVLAAYAVISVLAGWPWYSIMVFLGGAMMGWEWGRMCGGGRHGAGGTAVAVLVGAVAALGLFGYFVLALAVALAGIPAIWTATRWAQERAPAWQAAGMVCVALPVLSMHWVYAADPVHGQFTGGWIMLIAFTADIGAYFGGRWIGGPKLAPRISPAKTWAGLAGGVATALAVAAISAYLYAPALIWSALAGGAVLALVSPMGDLFESHVKRRFNVKDSSGIIPGHGGVLDRFDGLAAAMLTGGLVALLNEGSIWIWP